MAGDRAVLYFGEPIHSGYVLIPRAHNANVTSLEHEVWRRTPPSSAGRGNQVGAAKASSASGR